MEPLDLRERSQESKSPRKEPPTTTEEMVTGEALSKTVETLTTGVTCQQHKERLLAKPEEHRT